MEHLTFLRERTGRWNHGYALLQGSQLLHHSRRCCLDRQIAPHDQTVDPRRSHSGNEIRARRTLEISPSRLRRLGEIWVQGLRFVGERSLSGSSDSSHSRVERRRDHPLLLLPIPIRAKSGHTNLTSSLVFSRVLEISKTDALAPSSTAEWLDSLTP